MGAPDSFPLAAQTYALRRAAAAGRVSAWNDKTNLACHRTRVTKTCLLIDLENRQPTPELVAAWMGQDGEAWIFYGEQQISLLPNYWQLGDQVSIVPISRPGKNSLDFHLVLYLGYLVAKRKKGSRFVIVAADADYDPAVAHARAEGIDVVRLPELTLDGASGPVASKAASKKPTAPPRREPSRAPTKTKGNTKTTIAIYAGILKDIRGPNRPGDLHALTSRIQSRIGQAAAPEKVSEVMARLATMDVIQVVDGELSYLPKASGSVSSGVSTSA